MMKRFLAVLAGVIMLALPLCAAAESAVLEPNYYNPQNDFPPLGLAHKKNQADEEIQALRHGYFRMSGLLPLPEGNLLLYGTFQYQGLLMERTFNSDFDETPPRTDAYAVAVDPGGNRLWSLRLNDPQAQNLFPKAWLLEDNRILIKHQNYFGEWGTQYYIVSLEGEVQEMLPSYKGKEFGVSEILMPVAGGFLGGGEGRSDDGATCQMIEAVNLTLFDHTMEMLWRVDDDRLLGGYLGTRKEVEDGYLLAGSISQIIAPGEFRSAFPAVLKLSKAGRVVWLYQGNPLAACAAVDAVMTEDGGVLFVSNADPAKPTAYHDKGTGTLTLLDSAGNHVWTKHYLESHGFISFGSITPYHEGYLLSGELDTGGSALLQIDAGGAAIKTFELSRRDDMRCEGVQIATAPDGAVYAYGNLYAYPIPGDENNPVYKVLPFFAKVAE